MQYSFGVGFISLVPAGANPTPVVCGVLQECSVDVKQTQKELRGQNKFPVDVADGEGTISGKFKFGRFTALAFQNFLAGATQATGSMIGVPNEVHTIPANPGPYTITITPAGGGTFGEDLGVYDGTAGVVMTRVASAPATGQYSLALGVYTFAAADTGHSVFISYDYSSTAGFTVDYLNQPMGAGNPFQMTLYNTYRAKNVGILLPQVVVPSLSLGFKNNDFTLQDAEFAAFADPATGRVAKLYTSE